MAKLEDQESTQNDGIAYLYISKTMIWCAIAEHVMKDWSCERLVLVASKRFFSVARIVGPHLGCSVDEDAMVKLTEAQVALRAKRL